MFSLRMALNSIFREIWLNVISMLSIGAVLFILFSVVIAVYNVEKLTATLPEKLSVMVFLREDTRRDEARALESAIKSENIVKSVNFISKEKALQDMKGFFKNEKFALSGLGENPLFDTIDVRLKGAGSSAKGVNAFIEKLKGMSAVDDVEYGGALVESVYSLKNGLRVFGLTTGSIFALSVIFICYSTVRVLFYRHEEEIEIYKLLGATKGFIRSPFFIEGSIIGIMGGAIGMCFFLAISRYVFGKLFTEFPLFSMIYVPDRSFYILPVMGFVLGLGGAVIALGRLKY
ncbi:MAG: FtsX-like permease family protein [Nitrospirae bacterium]|nr:FtsX-like permease family protein [Nitrospirota bacterium]